MAKISFNGSRTGVQMDHNYGNITISVDCAQGSGRASDDDTNTATVAVNDVQVGQNFGTITIE